MSGTILSWRTWLLVFLFQHEKLFLGVQSFATSPATLHPFMSLKISLLPTTTTGSSALFAAKKKKKKIRTGGGGGMTFGGFGGAAMESCPCGEGGTYSSCCSKVHKDVQFFRKATAEQIVRARYSAYARKLPEFLMMSTHPNNKAFNPDLRAWKENIKLNMYDNFDMPKCVIVEEKYNEPSCSSESDDEDSESESETATVQFIAEMMLRETGEKTSFMEISQFERANNSGAWLYLSGDIEAVPTDDDDENCGDDDLSVEEKLASQL